MLTDSTDAIDRRRNVRALRLALAVLERRSKVA
jgi:hypothetical protein